MLTKEAADSYLEASKARNLSEKTLLWYRGILKPFATYCPSLPTQPEPVEEFLASQQCRVGDETLHGYYRVLRTFYRFAERRYRIWNPISLIKPPRRKKKVIQTLTSTEQATLLAFAAKNPRDRAILTLLLDSMIRAGELVSLRQSDINGNTIIVRGKTGEREVSVSPETIKMLHGLGKGNYVFMGQRGPLTVSGIKKIVTDYLKLIGCQNKKLGPHLLRHTAATQFIDNGGNPLILQRILGHSTLDTTNRYVHTAMRTINREHNRYTALHSVDREMCPRKGCGGQLFKDGEESFCILCGWRAYSTQGRESNGKSNNVT